MHWKGSGNIIFFPQICFIWGYLSWDRESGEDPPKILGVFTLCTIHSLLPFSCGGHSGDHGEDPEMGGQPVGLCGEELDVGRQGWGEAPGNSQKSSHLSSLLWGCSVKTLPWELSSGLWEAWRNSPPPHHLMSLCAPGCRHLQTGGEQNRGSTVIGQAKKQV